jgi:hypothetical protein
MEKDFNDQVMKHLCKIAVKKSDTVLLLIRDMSWRNDS